MQDCIFCKIAKRESLAQIEFENDEVVIFKSIKPVADTHLLVIPKKHTETFLDLNSNLMAEMLSAAQKIVNEKGLSKAYKLVFNGGEYQAIHHVHWHLLSGELEDKKDILNKL